jgi:hypothetical protein
MWLLALECFAMGACVLNWRLIVVLLRFLLLFALCLGLFVLLTVASAAPYADLVYSELESSPFIIE